MKILTAIIKTALLIGVIGVCAVVGAFFCAVFNLEGVKAAVEFFAKIWR